MFTKRLGNSVFIFLLFAPTSKILFSTLRCYLWQRLEYFPLTNPHRREKNRCENRRIVSSEFAEISTSCCVTHEEVRLKRKSYVTRKTVCKLWIHLHILLGTKHPLYTTKKEKYDPIKLLSVGPFDISLYSL